MLRVSAICEDIGVPAATLVCEGFVRQAAATSVGLGLPGMPVAVVPGHPDAQSPEEIRANVIEVTTQQVIDALLKTTTLGEIEAEPAEREIVCKGTFEEVNDAFYDRDWTDGLPIVPPTRSKIEAFLKFTSRKPEEVLGVMLPDRRAATVWSIAVNGVMAGCRPEYMPILVALVEAMCDEDYGVEHSGNTPGAETQIILNGPIIKQLGFNYTQGVMRDGFRANTAVGRFWRLYLRNVAGFILHKTDKGTYGNTFRVVVPENEDVLKSLEWPPLSADMGFRAGDNTVTISRFTGGGVIAGAAGSTAEAIMVNLADAILRQYSWQLCFFMGSGYGSLRPMLVLSPILAQTIARDGWTKQTVKEYLFKNARMPAWKFERYLRDWMNKPIWKLSDEVKAGRIPKMFHESDDPERLVPIVWKPEDYMVVVSGDPMRTNAYVFAHNGRLGFPTTKKISLPDNWTQMLPPLSPNSGSRP